MSAPTDMMDLRFLQQQQQGDQSQNEIEWDLGGCCQTQESLYLGLYAAYAVVFFCFSSTVFFKPVRLLCVFIHEFSHATGKHVSV